MVATKEKQNSGPLLKIRDLQWLYQKFCGYKPQNFWSEVSITSHVEIRDILNLPIKRASTEEQAAWSAFVHQSDKSKFELEQALSELNATYKRIISEQLG